jgi:hypothetical protein
MSMYPKNMSFTSELVTCRWTFASTAATSLSFGGALAAGWDVFSAPPHARNRKRLSSVVTSTNYKSKKKGERQCTSLFMK